MKIVAVTSCVSGVAHSHMAAAALKKTASAKGIDILVEVQGMMGIDKPLPAHEIEKADVVIIASDINITQRERFESKPVLSVKVAEAVKRPEQVLNKAASLIKG